MNDEYPTETEEPAGPGILHSFPMDAFIPLVLLSLSMIVLLGWQVSNSSTQRGLIENAIAHQKNAVDQSHQVQASLTKLVTDLLEAAQSDDEARKIVTKFNIQQNGGSAAPGPGL